MKKIFLIFILSFSLNFIWENLHSYLYASYLDGKITEFILFRASLVDASIITILSLPFIYLASLRKKSPLIIPVGVFIAIVIELYALDTGRWAYNEYMPIVPLLSVGLTPMIQLGLLGYFSYWFIMRKKETIEIFYLRKKINRERR